jgi:hypothetical protein
MSDFKWNTPYKIFFYVYGFDCCYSVQGVVFCSRCQVFGADIENVVDVRLHVTLFTQPGVNITFILANHSAQLKSLRTTHSNLHTIDSHMSQSPFYYCITLLSVVVAFRTILVVIFVLWRASSMPSV